MLLFSEACERNKEPILAVLRDVFGDRQRVIEIGAGTGQHAVHFARNLPHLTWQPTDRAEHLAGLTTRIAAEGPLNLAAPLELDVLSDPWPALRGDAVFSANTLHIMSWQGVEALFAGLRRILEPGSVVAISRSSRIVRPKRGLGGCRDSQPARAARRMSGGSRVRPRRARIRRSARPPRPWRTRGGTSGLPSRARGSPPCRAGSLPG